MFIELLHLLWKRLICKAFYQFGFLEREKVEDIKLWVVL